MQSGGGVAAIRPLRDQGALAPEAMPIGLDADIASLEALIGELALSIGVAGVVMPEDDDEDDIDDGVVVVSAGAVLLQPASTSAVAATAMPSGKVKRLVM